MAVIKRISSISLLLMVILFMSHCKTPPQPKKIKLAAAVKTPASCCTGKTPPRFGLKAPAAPQKAELDSLAKSGKK